MSAPALSFEGFRLAWRRPEAGSEHLVLDGVDLEVPAGGFHLLVGSSGSGKSTLMRLITGLWEVREPAPRVKGRFEILGHPVRGSLPTALRGRVQAVLQDEGLLDELSPRGNVELALRCADRSVKLAPALLAQAGLPEPPDDVASLSGGMRKRVAVARALAGEPAILIFDEPTAGLDGTSARAIAELLRQTHDQAGGKRTTIVITHDLAAFEGLTDGILHIDPTLHRLSLEREPLVESERRAVSQASSDGDGPVFDFQGLRKMLLEVADYSLTLAKSIQRLPPVFLGLTARLTTRYVLEAVLFVVLGCATVGGLASFFALRNNPLEGAFVGAVVTGSGKVLVAVLVPLLAGFFFTARIAAGAAARLGTMKRTSQIDALRLLGIRPVDYLLTPMVWATVLAMPLVTAAGIVMASLMSYLATLLVADVSGHAWARSYALELERVDFRFLLAKTILSGFLVAVQTYHLAVGPKRSGRDVGRSVNAAIVQGMSIVLLVHSILTLIQFG